MPEHLEKRHKGSWTIVIDLGRDPLTNKRKRLVRGFKGNKREAEKELARLINEYETGQYIKPSKIKLGQYLLRWLEDYGRPNLAPTTYYSYSKIIEKHIIPVLGNIILNKLQPMHLQQYYSQKLQTLSNRTVLYHHRVLKEALSHAVQWQLLSRNVADAVQAPKNKQKDIELPDLKNIDRLLNAAIEHRDYEIILCALFTGIRRGEILGLRWHDVDLKKNMIFVRNTLQRLPDKGLFFTEPKSKKSRRQILMPQFLSNILQNHRKRQLEEKLRLGQLYQDHNLVFPRPDGTPQDPGQLSHRFKDLVDNIGLSRLRFHDLRHFHATLLLSENINPKKVQERLGHQTISLTLDVYSHLIPSMQNEIAQKLDDIYGHRLGTEKRKSQ
ncbi:site-specific integrase [Desulfotomaculum varum]